MTTEYLTKPELGGFENKIVTYHEAITRIRENRERGLKVVLALGVFDVVHVGHLEYLRNAKLAGDLLFVGIENDLCIKLNKGDARPFNSLGDRLEFLSQLQTVDFVFGFDDAPPYDNPDSKDAYVQRYRELNPSAIAVKTWDSSINSKRIQADEAGVQLLYIDTPRRDSTTRLLQAIGYE
jgi:cytidyltransferase-like protein